MEVKRETNSAASDEAGSCFNPCFDGSEARVLARFHVKLILREVSILVLMEVKRE